jgi:hypothetical protein
MSPFWQNISNFEQREQDYAEAAGFSYAATALQNNAGAITSFLDAEAPQGVDALVNAIEKADAHVPGAFFINTMINSGKAEIEAELTPLVAEGTALIPAAVQSLNNIAEGLRAKAAAL